MTFREGQGVRQMNGSSRELNDLMELPCTAGELCPGALLLPQRPAYCRSLAKTVNPALPYR